MAYTVKVFNSLTRGSSLCKNYSALKYACNYSRDITKTSIPTSTMTPDYLFQNLKGATNSENVLSLVGAHYQIMNSKHLLQALRSLFTLQKYGNSNLSTQQIIKHPHFEKLCYSLKSQAGMIELNETLEALKVISFVGVSSNSVIVQVLLQLLRHNINDLSISHLTFLDFLLKQFKSSPLVDGLLIALPVVFEVNLPMKLDKENISHLADCLQYASKKHVSQKCIQLIVNSLVKAIDLRGLNDAKIANSILWSLCDMEPDEIYLPLFKRAINGLLTLGLDQLNNQEFTATLNKLLYKTTSQCLLYYDDIFYDSCSNHIIDKDLGFEEAIYTLLKFTRVNHTNDNLLNYASKKCFDNGELLMNAPPILISALVMVLAQSEYRPTYWPVLKEAIQSTKCFEKYDKQDIIWLKLAASLSSLDIYKFDVLEKAFQTSYLKYILKFGHWADYENFLLLVQSINTFEPDYKHLLPEQSFIATLVSKIKPVVDYPLETALQKALGGESYVNTCMRTKLFHHIDHVIIMRKGGYPVPLKKNYQYIEDIEVPADGFMILVLALNHRQYTINTKRLTASSLLMIKCLEEKGYNVVPICLEVWENLPDFERIPFIMQAIKLKIETQAQMTNAVG